MLHFWKRTYSFLLLFSISSLFLFNYKKIYVLSRRLYEHIKTRFLSNKKSKEILENKNVKIYYGSQGGTAESFAKELQSNLKDLFKLSSDVIDLEFFSKEEIRHAGIRIFIVATYGNGEPTDNAVEFFNWMKDLSDDNTYFRNTKYSIMGLGSSEYVHFNKIAKKLEKYLRKFKAERISQTVYGDDSENIYYHFEQWKNAFFTNLPKILNIPNISINVGAEETIKFENWRDIKELPLDIQFEEDTVLVKDNSKHMEQTVPVQTDGTAKLYTKYHVGKVLSNKNLLNQENALANEDKVNHVIVSINKVSYNTADTFLILPKNSTEVVSWWLKRLNVENEDRNKKFLFVIRDPCVTKEEGSDQANKDDGMIMAPFETPCTIEEALQYYCDLTTIPHFNVLKKFKCFIKEVEELKMFHSILSSGKRNTFFNVCKEASMNFIEFVDIYMPSAQFELAPFFQLIPKNKPKAYTISSAPIESKEILTITVKKKQHPMHSLRRTLKLLISHGLMPKMDEEKLRRICKQRRQYKGICSFYITEELKEQEEVRFFIKPSKFRLPEKLESTSIIMIATGTGIAPFKGFLTEFIYHDQKIQNNPKIKKTAKRVLFFGCRKKKHDFLYGDELIKAKENHYIDELYFAFSRDTEQKIYVQNLMWQNKDLVFNLIKHGAYIYVCGNTNMSQAVHQTVRDIATSFDKSMKNILKTLKKSGRFIEEVW